MFYLKALVVFAAFVSSAVASGSSVNVMAVEHFDFNKHKNGTQNVGAGAVISTDAIVISRPFSLRCSSGRSLSGKECITTKKSCSRKLSRFGGKKCTTNVTSRSPALKVCDSGYTLSSGGTHCFKQS